MMALGVSVLAGIVGGTLGGCSAGSPATHDGQGATRLVPAATPVYATDALRAWEERPGTPPEVARFEFARNNSDVAARTPTALRATDQWPEPARPPERIPIFRFFEQR